MQTGQIILINDEWIDSTESKKSTVRGFYADKHNETRFYLHDRLH